MAQYRTTSPEETEALGFRLGECLHGGEVLALFGGLGMGKTAFTRGIAAGLGIPSGVSSPTFALVHDYTGRLTVYLLDMYRVGGRSGVYCTVMWSCR